jgi:hypothetical protein
MPENPNKAYSSSMSAHQDASVKILRPELLSGAFKLQQNSMAQIFTRKFQENVDDRMQFREQYCKGEAKTLADFEDLFDNSTVESQKKLAMIIEAVKLLFGEKKLLMELAMKDKLLRDGDQKLLRRLESDLAKMVVKAYEEG